MYVNVFYYFIPFFFIPATSTTEIYTLSLHDALPIFADRLPDLARFNGVPSDHTGPDAEHPGRQVGHALKPDRSEEHTSELQSGPHLVCRLLLEKKNIGLLCDLSRV